MALALVACATAEDTSTDGGGNPIVTAGAGTTGGSASSSAGTSGLPVAGTTVVPLAGTTSVGTGGTPAATGGTGSSTAGTAATTGGTVAAGGTASASTCPQYTGTLAKDSAIFDGGFGKSTGGAWSGYGYTYKYGTATIAPGTGNSCFAGKKFCANGTVPAADTSGAGLGWNIAQMMGASTMSKVPVTGSVTISFAGVPGGSRVQLSASSTTSYCYTLSDAEITAGSTKIAATSFKTECWGTAGVAYDGVVPIEAIQIAVPGSTTGVAKTFDFCVTDIEPG